MSSFLFIPEKFIRKIWPVLTLDAKHKVTKYELPQFFLVVKSYVGYRVVASFMLGHENSREIASVLEKIKEWNEGWHPVTLTNDKTVFSLVSVLPNKL